MDRTLVYPGQQPTDTVWLSAERNKMIAQAYQAQAILGSSTVVDGLVCIPTVPASLAVQIGNGSIYSLTSVDTLPYGSLPLDNVDLIMKQGIALSVPNLTLVPPSTSGFAVNYLIQAELVEQDTNNTVLPYFNSAQPTVPFNGPNNQGTAQPTLRQCTLVVQAKIGVAATAGTQVTPAPDAGFVGLYSITVANGATAITSAQITTLPTAPFIGVKLPSIPQWVQAGSCFSANDTGTANAINITLSPVPTSPPALLKIRKIAAANTTAMTVTVNNITYPLLNSDGSAIAAAEMGANYLPFLGFDGTAYRFLNGSATTAVGSLSASSGEGVNVNGSGVVALNFPSLVDQPNIAAGDLIAFYSQGDVHHRVLQYAELIAALNTSRASSLLNVTLVTATQTWNKTTGAKKALVFVTAPGGGGGGATGGDLIAAGGGGSGGTSVAFVDLTGVTSVACTMNAPGLGGYQPGNTAINGQNGGTASFGTYATANGGNGGRGNYPVSDGFGGAGGAPGTGMVAIQGGPGVPGTSNSSGPGGNSFWGGGAGAITNLDNAGKGNGFNGGNYGGGGGGADNQAGPACTGGNGGPGMILIIEFS